MATWRGSGRRSGGNRPGTGTTSPAEHPGPGSRSGSVARRQPAGAPSSSPPRTAPRRPSATPPWTATPAVPRPDRRHRQGLPAAVAGLVGAPGTRRPGADPGPGRGQPPRADRRAAAARAGPDRRGRPHAVRGARRRRARRHSRQRPPVEVFRQVRVQFPASSPVQLGLWVDRFFRLFARNQWKRERYAPSFHLDDENLDPKTWCRFPILSAASSASWTSSGATWPGRRPSGLGGPDVLHLPLPGPAVTADVVLWGCERRPLRALVERGHDRSPAAGPCPAGSSSRMSRSRARPGASSRRRPGSRWGARAARRLGRPGARPARHVVTVAYVGLVRVAELPPAPPRTRPAPTGSPSTACRDSAFDHDRIIAGALARLGERFRLCPERYPLLRGEGVALGGPSAAEGGVYPGLTERE